MAQKRMFDRAIIETSKFLDVSLSAKALYFLLGMEADDEGFVSPKRILRLYGGEMGDIKNLIDVGLVIPFNSGVIVITDWKKNNWLDSRRIKPTEYQDEKLLLTVNNKDKYVLLSGGLANVKPEERRGEERSIVERSNMSVKTDAFAQFWEAYPKKELRKKSQEVWERKKLDSHLKVILNFITGAKNTDRWKKGYVKQAPTFLNGECWNDDLNSYKDSYNSRSKSVKIVQ